MHPSDMLYHGATSTPFFILLCSVELVISLAQTPQSCDYRPAPLGLAIRQHFNFPFTLQLVYLHLGDIFLCGGAYLVRTH